MLDQICVVLVKSLHSGFTKLDTNKILHTLMLLILKCFEIHIIYNAIIKNM